MPTDVFGRGHAGVGGTHAHEDVGMATGSVGAFDNSP